MTADTTAGTGPQRFADEGEVVAAVHDLVRDSFRLYTRTTQGERKNLFGLTMSALGGCLRQCAYRLSGTKPSDPHLALEGENRATHVGTWIHAGLLPFMAKAAGSAQDEHALVLHTGDDEITGTSDLWWYGSGVVLDLKTGMQYYEHRIQVGGYALACMQAGESPEWVVWVYLDRKDRRVRERVIVERWTEEYALEVLEFVWAVQGWRDTPDAATRARGDGQGMAGPGQSFVCDGCPWLRRCWGETAEPGVPGAQATLARDEPAVADALHRYTVHRDGESNSKGDKAFFREVATGGGRKPGTYSGPSGTYRFWWGRPGERLDLDAVRALYAKLGMPLPMKPEAPRLYVREAEPDVKAPPADEAAHRVGST